MAQSPVIILVHGTWSTPKIWDCLRDHLALHLGLRFPVLWESISWSGGNSAAARRKGTASFEETVRNYTDRPIFVICHSHGANLVLEADKAIRGRLGLLVCLNSPILTTVKIGFPWPFLLGFVGLLAGFLALGVISGLDIESNYLRAFVLLLVTLFFWLANSRWAFLLLLLFGIAATILPLGFAIHITDRAYYLKNSWLMLVSVASMIAPTLVLYACWARRYAKAVNPETVAGLTHIVAVDDEVFLLLGLALAVQRAIQLTMCALVRPFTIGWLFVAGCAALFIMATVGLFFPSVYSFMEAKSMFLAVPVAVPLYIGGLLIFVKVVLFGIAYGWDTAGLAMDHAIYVSPGSFVQETDLYVIEPEDSWHLRVSHTEIHQRRSTLDLITKLLQRAFEPSRTCQ